MDLSSFDSTPHPINLDVIRQIESGGNDQAVSPAGAQGPYQLMPKTAASLGVTDPFNEPQARDGADRLMQSMWDKYHDVDKTIAGYNAGEPAVNKYGGIPPFKETQNYVKKYHALNDVDTSVFDSPKTIDTSSFTPPIDTSSFASPATESDTSGISSNQAPGLMASATDAASRLGEAAITKPLSIIPGAAEALAGGVGGMGVAAATGLGGLGRGAYEAATGGDFMGGFSKGAEATQQALQPISQALQPETDFGKAALSTLSLLPEAAHSLGETAFEHTGSPTLAALLEGAGNAAMFTPLAKGGVAKELAENPTALEHYTMHRAGFTNDTLDKVLGPSADMHPVVQKFVAGELTGRAALDELMSDPRKPATAQAVLQVLSRADDMYDKNPSVGAYVRDVASTLETVGNDVGLENVQMKPKPASPDDAGQYKPLSDTIETYGSRGQAPDVLVHEIMHSINYSATRLYESTKLDPTDPLYKDISSLTPEQQVILGQVDRQNDVLQAAREAYFEQHKADPDIGGIAIRSQDDFNSMFMKDAQGNFINKDWVKANNRYGLADLHEFGSEVLGGVDRIKKTGQRTGFQRELLGQRLTAEQRVSLADTSTRPIKRMWDAAWGSLKKALMGDVPDVGDARRETMLGVAFDHVTGLTDSMTPEMRTRSAQDETGIPYGKAQIDEASKAIKNYSDGEQFQIMHDIKNISHDAATRDEFNDRITTMYRDPAWRDFAEKNVDRLWNGRNQIIKSVSDNLNYDKMKPGEQQMVSDPRNIDEFMPQLKKKWDIAPDGKALGEHEMKWDEGLTVLPDYVIKVMKAGDSLGGDIIKWYLSKSEEVKAMSSKLFAEATQYMVPYHSLKVAEKMEMFQTVFKYNHMEGKQALIDAGLQWPTKAMLDADGVSPKIRDAYLAQTKASDFAFKLLNEGLAKRGMPDIEQIPGFMPHIHEGAYKVFIKATEKTTAEEALVHIMGFNTRGSAAKFVAELNAGKHDTQTHVMRPDPDPQFPTQGWRLDNPEIIANTLVDNFKDHLDAYKNLRNMPIDLVSALEKAESSVLSGYTKHVMERADVGGYAGETGFNSSLLAKMGLDRQNNKVLNLYDNYIKNVVQFHRNAIFMKDVYDPLMSHMEARGSKGNAYGDMLDNLQATPKYIREHASNFTGSNVNHLKVIDQDIMMTMTDQMGLDPSLIGNVVNHIRNIVSVTALRGNVAFYLSNVFQPGYVVSLLSYSDVMRLKPGGGGGAISSPYKAFATVMARAASEDSPEHAAALGWAKDQHSVDPLLEYQMRKDQPGTVPDMLHTLTGGKINNYIEGFGKERSFLIAYQHYRNIGMDVPNSRSAAQQIMRMTMVDYSSESRALMFQNFGMAGKLASPFAQFMNSYTGNLVLMMKEVARNPMDVSSYKPFVAQMLFYMATAGVVGMPLFNMYNGLADIAKKIFPEWHISTMQSLLMKAMVATGVPKSVGDAISMGWISQGFKLLPGVTKSPYIGGPLGAVDPEQGISTAVIPILDAFKDIGTVVARGITAGVTGDPTVMPTLQDVAKAARPLTPQPLRPLIERGIQPAGSDVVGNSVTLEGQYRRDNADWTSLYMTGKMTIEEQQARWREAQIKADDKADQASLKKLVEQATQIMNGDSSSASIAEIQKRASIIIGDDPTGIKFRQMVADEVTGTRTTPAQRDAMAKSIISKRNQQRRAAMGGYEIGQ